MTSALALDSAVRCVVPSVLCLGLLACHRESTPTEHQTGTSVVSRSIPAATSNALQTLDHQQQKGSDPSDIILGPRKLVAGEKLPFILWLHGLGASGESLRAGLHVDDLANKHRFFYATPNGTPDSRQRRFWNAGPICCDFDGRGVDHVERLSHILAEAARMVAVDPGRMFVVGFSNGGFMAHRLACGGATPLAGIASMAGLGPGSAYACKPSGSVRIIEIHGDADTVVRMEGGHLLDNPEFPEHPSLRSTLEFWVKQNGCRASEPRLVTVDLLPNLAGAETTQSTFANCTADVELWTIAGGGHMASNAPGVIRAVVQRLLGPK